jgi:chromosomal replication initiator protein
MKTIWDEVKTHVKSALSEKSFSLWIDPITFVDQKDDAFILGCPNKFSRNWITEHYIKILEQKLNHISNENYKITLNVQASKKRIPTPSIFKDSKQFTLPNMPISTTNGVRRLNNEFTFERFVVGACNEFAYSASKAFAVGGKWPYDSIFMLANTGLGKSHLSQAVGHAIHEKAPELRVFYITTEDFVNEMIFGLNNNRIDEFKNRYRRSCDVLLLEEVHFLSGKEKTQLELGYTLDVLANDHKKIIFTSSLLPKDIPNMTKALSSRLTSGIITTIERPDFSTRVKILEKKSSEQNLEVPEEIIHLFAKHLSRDVRQIESALSCLKAKSELLNEKISLDHAKEVITCHAPEQSGISIEAIQKLVCQYFRVDFQMLQSKSRKKIHAYPRKIYVYLCRNYTDETLEEIGRSINRIHSTVLYATEVIEHKMNVDRKVKNQVQFLSQKLKGLTK